MVRPGGETMTLPRLAMASAAVMQAVAERVGDVAHRLVGVAVRDAAGFVASALGVLEAGGVVMPLDLRRGVPALEREAARARALAVIVGDAEDDRLDVVAVDASRREMIAEACLVVDAGVHKAVHSRAGFGIAVDALVAQVGLEAGSRLALTGPLAAASLLTTAIATLRAGGAIVDGAGRGANVLSGSFAELVAHAAASPDGGAGFARVILVGDGDVAELRHAFASARIGRALDTGEALRVAAAEEDAPWSALPDVTVADVAARPLEVRSPAAMLGYLDEPGETVAAFFERDGARFVRAWPLDCVDASALERTLRNTPGVREAAVVAVRDAAGERLHAFVAAADGAPLPRHPARVVTLDSLPHAPTEPSIARRSAAWPPSTDRRFSRTTTAWRSSSSSSSIPSRRRSATRRSSARRVAALIDPVVEEVERDLARVAAHGFRLVHTVETHVHADHVTGGGALAERTGSRPVVHRTVPVEPRRVRLGRRDAAPRRRASCSR